MKIERSKAQEWVQKVMSDFLEEMKKQGVPLEVGVGDMKTEEDLLKIKKDMETQIWRCIESQHVVVTTLSKEELKEKKDSLRKYDWGETKNDE